MRLKNIILTDLAHDKLICYEKLERAMNSKDDIDVVSIRIKKQLKNLVLLDGMIAKWGEIQIDNTDNDLNNKNNG